MEGALHPDPATLRRIRSLCRFDDRQLAQLASALLVESARDGECLFDFGSGDTGSLYLLEGMLEVSSTGQEARRIESSGAGELYPVARVRPSLYRVVAAGPVRFLRLPAECLVDFSLQVEGDRSGVDIEFGEPAESGKPSPFTLRLFEDLLGGELHLPSLPDVAQRIQQAFADNLVTPGTVGVIIQSDPVITAKLIMIANSPLYGGRATIESLRQAIVRLGLENTRKLVMTFAVRELFESRSPAMRSQMQAVWKHSQHVASLCRLLAEHVDGFDAEQAQLAGLVHDIGEVAILHYAQQQPELCDDPQSLASTVRTMRPRITGLLLQEWQFMPEFVTVGQECEDWFRNPADRPDLCDLVLIAQYHAMIGSPMQRRLPPIATLPAFEKLGMGNIDVEQVKIFMQKSRDKLRSIQAHLDAF